MTIYCACGCGQQLEEKDGRGRRRKFIHGHNGVRSDQERLAQVWERVDKAGPVPDYAPHLGPCWIWTGFRGYKNGYGYFNWDRGRGRKPQVAHRIVYTLVVGPIPKGLHLDHLCRNPPCVNPAHLEPVTHRENLRRGVHRNGNTDKTHCKNGHEFTPENTYRGKGKTERGSRTCRICMREYRRIWDRNRRDR